MSEPELGRYPDDDPAEPEADGCLETLAVALVWFVVVLVTVAAYLLLEHRADRMTDSTLDRCRDTVEVDPTPCVPLPTFADD